MCKTHHECRWFSYGNYMCFTYFCMFTPGYRMVSWCHERPMAQCCHCQLPWQHNFQKLAEVDAKFMGDPPCSYVVFLKWEYPNSWMVYFMENSIIMDDDWGYPYSRKSSISISLYIRVYIIYIYIHVMIWISMNIRICPMFKTWLIFP
jgi:hypothetical protein